MRHHDKLRKQVPPLVYPLFATLVWYSVRLLLRVPRVREWAFALENRLAVCGDDQKLSHWHLSRARASKAYAGFQQLSQKLAIAPPPTVSPQLHLCGPLLLSHVVLWPPP